MKRIVPYTVLLTAEAVAAGTGGGTAADREAQSVGASDVGSVDSVLGAAGDADFLNDDMSGVDTSMPIVKEQPCELEIKKVEKLPTKDGSGFKLKISLKSTGDLETTTGDVVTAGFPFFTNIAITPTADNTEDMIKKRVALFVQCCSEERLFPLDKFEGKIVSVRISIRKERVDKNTGDTWPASNEVKFVKK